MLEHTPTPEAAKKWGISKLGRIWLIPQSTEKPFDQRLKGRKEDARENISCR